MCTHLLSPEKQHFLALYAESSKPEHYIHCCRRCRRLSLSLSIFFPDFLWLLVLSMCDSLDSWFNCVSRDQRCKLVLECAKEFSSHNHAITITPTRMPLDLHTNTYTGSDKATERQREEDGPLKRIGKHTVHNINSVDYHKFAFMGQLCSRWQLNIKRNRKRAKVRRRESTLKWSRWTITVVVRTVGASGRAFPNGHKNQHYFLNNLYRTMFSHCIISYELREIAGKKETHERALADTHTNTRDGTSSTAPLCDATREYEIS